MDNCQSVIREFRHMCVECKYCATRKECEYHNYPLCTNDSKCKQFDADAFENDEKCDDHYIR